MGTTNTQDTSGSSQRPVVSSLLQHFFSPPPSSPTQTQTMGLSEQAIYLSMGLLSLAGLTGMGVAVGSGVAMMSMAEEAKVNQAPAAAPKAAASSVKEPTFLRGFAASSL